MVFIIVLVFYFILFFIAFQVAKVLKDMQYLKESVDQIIREMDRLPQRMWK